MDKNDLAIKLFDHHAEDYQRKYFDVSLYENSLDFLISLLSELTTILEVGSGPGNVARYILDRKSIINYTATDLSPKMVELASVNNPEVKTQILDCRDFSIFQKPFNCIISSFCIPYLNPSEVVKFVHDSFEHLHSDGLLYLSFISSESDKIEFGTADSGLSVYMHYYSQITLENILKTSFKIIHFQEYLSYNKKDIDLVIIAKKNDL